MNAGTANFFKRESIFQVTYFEWGVGEQGLEKGRVILLWYKDHNNTSMFVASGQRPTIIAEDKNGDTR